MYNLRSKIRIEEGLAATIDAHDLDLTINEMQNIASATVKFCKNQANEFDAVLFQNERMKLFFERFPDLLMFDGTYCLNDRRMPLVSMEVIDGNGETHIAGLLIVRTESLDILDFVFERFQAANLKHDEIQGILTDKSLVYRNIIKERFGNAAHHLCIFHVEQIFNREIATKKRNISKAGRTEC